MSRKQSSGLEAEKLLDELEFLLRGYAEVPRNTTQPYYLAKLTARNKGYVYDPSDALIRESLLEHIGSTPIVAMAFYPHLNEAVVDLGRAFSMLAIHDIGELEVGDESTFTKKDDSKQHEREAALCLLHPSYHELYDEMELRTSPTAEFAKAIDKITPDIVDYLTPAEITIRRLKYFVGVEGSEIVDLIVRHKRPYMLWNPFMTEFHMLLCERLAAKLELAI